MLKHTCLYCLSSNVFLLVSCGQLATEVYKESETGDYILPVYDKKIDDGRKFERTRVYTQRANQDPEVNRQYYVFYSDGRYRRYIENASKDGFVGQLGLGFYHVIGDKLYRRTYTYYEENFKWLYFEDQLIGNELIISSSRMVLVKDKSIVNHESFNKDYWTLDTKKRTTTP